MTLTILLALGIPLATARASAPAAGLVANRPSFTAGSRATFTGRGFAPGEMVTFAITGVRGTPIAGGNHTPLVAVADPHGGIVATWIVSGTGRVGELLQIEATGRTSGKVAHAVFMALPPGPAHRAPAATANDRSASPHSGGMVAMSAPTFGRIKSFGTPGPGYAPQASLVRGTDGALYGTASAGGASGAGTLFRLNPDGTGFTVLRGFNYATGGNPNGALLQGMDGALYGTTASGGSGYYGTVFRVNTDGSGYTVLQNLDNTTTGGNPYGGLVQGSDGTLYGTASGGGSGGFGTVFKLNTDGTGFTVLYDFDGGANGGSPYAGLGISTDGTLYGTAYQGGSSSLGTIFKLNPDGSGFTVLQDLDYSTNGAYPQGSAPIQGADGAIYGTVSQGGSFGFGIVFRMNTDGTGFTVLQDFDLSTTGGYLYGGLTQGTDGMLYGVSYQGGSGNYGNVYKLNPDGTGFAEVKSFTYSNGATPWGGVVQGTDSALYGTTYQGGTSSYGNVFKVDTNGTGFTVLKDLNYGNDFAADGGYPGAPPVQATDGKLYGTTQYGGTNSVGTVYRVNADGTGYTVIQHLDPSTTGASPWARLMQGMDGALYGTSSYGGSIGYGTVFKLNTDGSGLTVLKDFDIYTAGANIYGGLVQGSDGTLYGTAFQGGSGLGGTVFKLNPDGSGFAVLRSFNPPPDVNGSYLFGGLAMGTDGTLYGMTYYGGSLNYGTVFKMNSDGSGFTVLKSFDNSTSGANPYIGSPIQGADGALYGTTVQGGTSGYGTVFKLNTDGTGFTVLQNFDYSTTGGYVHNGLAQGTDGALYGTANSGGIGGFGTLFRLNTDGSDFGVLQGFDNGPDGGNSYGGTSRGSDGNIYGATYGGGDAGVGTLHRLVFPSTSNSITPVPASSACLTSPSSCVPVSMAISNGSGSNIRGFSVTFQLSANLDLCAGTSSITEGTYLNAIGTTAFQVVDHGGGSYTADGAILGLPCGATAASGTLFNVAVKKSGADGTGTITITSLIVRDCVNADVPFTPGAPASITIDSASPVAVANLAASQVKTGNDADGTTKVNLTFTAPGDAATVEVYRKGFGGYPQYDENGGAAPSVPASYPPAGWTMTSVIASGQSDEVATRDYWYYVVYTKDACGNVSAVSNMTGGTLNYHLGDTHNGVSSCAGNNLVNTSDISFLGANYGVTVPVNGALQCLDVGPTTTNTVDGRPTTDNRVQFEDLILFAINYGQVSAPQDAPRLAAAERNTLELEVPGLPNVGETFAVGLRASGAGDVQGMSVKLRYDAQVAEFLGVDAGELLSRQGAPSVALSSEAGVVDAAVLGTGVALRGTGSLAIARFRVRAAGDPGIVIGSLSARDGANRAVAVAYAGGPVGVPPSGRDVPTATALMPPSPNPSAGATSLSFTLAREGRVELAVYGLDGRRVRSLLSETKVPGTYQLEWDGRDEAGRFTRAGMYFVRLSTADRTQTRRVLRMQ